MKEWEGRPKDRDYVRVALARGLVDPVWVRALLSETPIEPEHRQRIEQQVETDAREVSSRQ